VEKLLEGGARANHQDMVRSMSCSMYVQHLCT